MMPQSSAKAINHHFYLRFLKAGLLLFLIVGAVSCSTQTGRQRQGIWHTLAPGETLEVLSRRYSVPIIDIKRRNDIYDPEDLAPGIRLYIPIPPRIKPVPPSPEQKNKGYTTRFSWPSQGTISSGFGIRHGKMHTGIDITRDRGRDIKAAGAGTVEFAGRKNGYGYTVIINHGSGYKTLYAHNARLYVKKGTRVNRGAVIARMGASGRSNGIHLHFEVRYRNKPQNPLRYLPIR